MEAGVLAGFPVVDVKVTLYDGSYHEVDSSELAFKIAGSMAFKEACQKADPVILEPIMKVCIIVPDEYMGDVIGDVTSRRGNIAGLTQRNGRAADRLLRSAFRDVRLRDQPPLENTGPRPVYHGAQPLCGTLQEPGGRRYFKAQRILSALDPFALEILLVKSANVVYDEEDAKIIL